MDKQKLNSEANLNDIKLETSILKEETINDLFENTQNLNQNLDLTNKNINQKENETKTDPKKRPDAQHNKKNKTSIFTLPVIILMALIVILILIIIYIIRKKMSKNDDLIEDYENQKEKILKENLELRKEIELTKQKVKLLNETNQELQEKFNEKKYDMGQYKTKTFKEHKADKWKLSNKYINDNKKESPLKQETIIDDTQTSLELDQNKHKKDKTQDEIQEKYELKKQESVEESIEENIENLLN